MDRDNKSFWDVYYKSYSDKIDEHSTFAEYVYKEYMKSMNDRGVFLKVGDLGSGNCRDSNLFGLKGNRCYSIDKSGVNKYNNENVELILDDVEEVLRERKLLTMLDLVYMRWFLHAMEYEKGGRVFRYSVDNVKEGGLICIEVRSINDESLKKASVYDEKDGSYKTSHKRWLYDREMCEGLARSNNCEIVSYGEGNYSPNATTETENPLLIRLILRKLRVNHSKSENYKLYKSISDKMREERKRSYEDMNKMNDILDRYKIRYVGVAGTMLGLNRSGGIISWDNDIDIGFLREDWLRLMSIKVELERHGLKIKRFSNKHVHFGSVDCFEITKKGEYYVGDAGVYCHVEDLKNLRKQKFGGTVIYCSLGNCNRSLRHRYGEKYYVDGDVNDNHHFKDKSVGRFKLMSEEYSCGDFE